MVVNGATMRRNRAADGTITGITEVTAERVRLTGELLQALTYAIAREAKTQRKFRDAVLIRLSRIEAIANLTHAAVIGTFHYNDPRYEEKLMEDARHAEQFVSEKSQAMALAMMNYVHGGAAQPASKSKRRPKWSDCPSYEI